MRVSMAWLTLGAGLESMGIEKSVVLVRAAEGTPAMRGYGSEL
jgi:hypothetical protein